MAIRELPKYESRTNYIHVENTANFVQRLMKVENAPELLSCDTETYYDPSLRAPEAICKWIKGAKNNRPFGASFFTGTQGYWVDTNMTALEPLLTSPIVKTFHNSKYDINMLKNIGLEMGGFIWDTMIMIQLIDEEFMCKIPIGEDGVQKYKKSKALKNLGYHFFEADAHDLEDMVHEYRKIIAANTGRSVEQVSYKEVNDACRELMKDYAVFDTELGWKLERKFDPMLKAQDLLEAYYTDMNATLAVVDMEREGFLIDKELLLSDEARLTKLIKGISDDIFDVCGCSFNINSDAELVTEFEKMGLPWRWFTDKGELSTDKKVMKEICDNPEPRIQGLAKLVLPYRKASKILSTYVIGIKDYIQEDGKIHPDFWVSPGDYDNGGTRTGRLSSSNPNFQNIPKKPIQFESEDEEEI